MIRLHKYYLSCSGTSSHLLLLRQQVSCKPCCFGYADLRRLCPAAIWFAERHLPSSNCSLSYIDSAKPLTHGTKHGSSRDKLSVLERDTLASKPSSHVRMCKGKQKGKANTSATTHTLHTRSSKELTFGFTHQLRVYPATSLLTT